MANESSDPNEYTIEHVFKAQGRGIMMLALLMVILCGIGMLIISMDVNAEKEREIVTAVATELIGRIENAPDAASMSTVCSGDKMIRYGYSYDCSVATPIGDSFAIALAASHIVEIHIFSRRGSATGNSLTLSRMTILARPGRVLDIRTMPWDD